MGRKKKNVGPRVQCMGVGGEKRAKHDVISIGLRRRTKELAAVVQHIVFSWLAVRSSKYRPQKLEIYERATRVHGLNNKDKSPALEVAVNILHDLAQGEVLT